MRVFRATMIGLMMLHGIEAGSTFAQRIFWTQAVETSTENDRIELRSARIDGTEVRTLLVVEDARLPSGITLDLLEGRIYFAIECANECTSGVWRVDLDGRRSERIIEIPVVGIDIDPVAGKLYFVTWVEPEGRRIWRSNLDGSDRQSLVIANARGLALDLVHRKMYWTTWIERNLVRADLDGSNVELISEFDGVSGFVSVDALAGYVYWPAGATVQRCNLDGSNKQSTQAINRISAYKGIAIDPRESSGDVYLTTWYDFRSSQRQIVRFAEQRCFDNGRCWFDDIVDLPVASREVGDLAIDLWGRGQGLSLGDVGPLAGCLAGPGVVRATECFTSDFDGDGRIDLFDFALLQRHAKPSR